MRTEYREDRDQRRHKLNAARRRLRKTLEEAVASVEEHRNEMQVAYDALLLSQQWHSTAERDYDEIMSVDRALKQMRGAATDMGSRRFAGKSA
jgi:hypothetical protein